MNRSVDFRFDATLLLWDNRVIAAKRAIVHEARRRGLCVMFGADRSTDEIVVRVEGKVEDVEQLQLACEPKQIEPAVNPT